MGLNVFGLEPSDNLAEETIKAIEAFYQSLGVDVQFSGYEGEKQQAVDSVINQLEQHGMVALGENQAIDLNQSRKILELAIA